MLGDDSDLSGWYAQSRADGPDIWVSGRTYGNVPKSKSITGEIETEMDQNQSKKE